MTEPTSDEVRQFILENRERILEILDEGDLPHKEEIKETEEVLHEAAEELHEKVKSRSDSFRELFFDIINDKGVQEHFLTGCLEFVHCVESIFDALRKSEEMEEFTENLKETKANIERNAVKVTAKDKIENFDFKSDFKEVRDTVRQKVLKHISISDDKDKTSQKETDQ